jgi:hypothetical protein
MDVPGLRTLRRLSRRLFGRKPVIETVPGRVTFTVSDVVPAPAPLAEVTTLEAIKAFLDGPVESCSHYHGALVAGVRSHPLIATLHAAFRDHRPVCLSPDVVWLTLAQGFAHHVNAHAEELRPLLVRHAGKLAIQVRRDDFVKGSPENPWPEAFAAFSDQIRGHIGDETHALVVSDFSTTGPVERAASEVGITTRFVAATTSLWLGAVAVTFSTTGNRRFPTCPPSATRSRPPTNGATT